MSMTPKQFMEEVYEIAFGENAYHRGFFPEEVLETLREFHLYLGCYCGEHLK